MAGMTTAEKLPVTLTVFAEDGVTPEKLDGPMVWLSSDETVMTGAPDADGLTGFAVSVGPGTAHFTWSGDADLGPGVTTITLVSEDVIVTPSILPAAVIKGAFGPAVPK